MVITLGADLESALNNMAREQGVATEALAFEVLRERLLAPSFEIQPRDAWERQLLGAASDCGTALSHAAVSSEGVYEQCPTCSSLSIPRARERNSSRE